MNKDLENNDVYAENQDVSVDESMVDTDTIDMFEDYKKYKKNIKKVRKIKRKAAKASNPMDKSEARANIIVNKRSSRATGFVYGFAILISFLWFVVAVVSIKSFDFSLGDISLQQLGGALSGLFIPVFFVWLIAFYIDRVISSAYEKSNIYSFLSSVFNSDEKGKEFIDIIEGNISFQVENLHSKLREIEEYALKVQGTYTNIVESNEEFIGNLKVQNDFLTKLDARINSTTGDNVARLSSDLKNIANDFDSISGMANEIDKTMTYQVKNLSDSLNKVFEDSKSISLGIETSSDLMLEKTAGSSIKIQKIAEDMKRTVAVLDEVFQGHNSTIDNVINYFEAQGDLLEESLKKQAFIFDKRTMGLNEKVEESQSKIETYLKKIDSASEKMTEESTQVSEVLDKFTVSMDSKSQAFVDFVARISAEVKESNEVLQSSMAELLDATNEIKENTLEASSLMGENVDELVEKTTEASKQARTIKDTIEQQANDLAGVANQVAAQARLSEFSLEEQSNKLSESYQNFLLGLCNIEDKMKMVRGNIADVMDGFEKTSGGVNEKLAIISQNISHNILGITETVDVFDTINEKMEDSIKKLSKVRGVVAGGDSVETLETSTYRDNRNSSSSASAGAGVGAGFVDNKIFFNNTSTMIDKLNSIAVDISRVYDPNIQESLWNAYYSGQKNIFTRFVAKKFDRRQLVAVRDLIETNGEFASYVYDFIAQYEKLMFDAERSEGKDVMLPIINASEYGRVYQFLKGLVV